MNKIRFYVYILLGTMSLILGIIGIFLPILPTTPFLLLASFCYVRSSKKMNDWLLNHKYLGSYLRDYLEYKGIRRKNRRYSLTFLWVTLIGAMLLSMSLHLTIFLSIIGCLVTIHIMRLEVLEDE